MDDINEQIRLHSAGVIVRHTSDFNTLPSFKNSDELSQEFLDEWAAPYYMRIGDSGDGWRNELNSANKKITKDIVVKLLGDVNWRTRQTGAFFAAIKNYTDLTDIIGVHFLKSELTYAGKTYAYTFASFNTPASVDYLDRYLTYYLSMPDLWYNQREALESLIYTDRINNTDVAVKHMENWTKFTANKPYWDKTLSTDALEEQLQLIESITK